MLKYMTIFDTSIATDNLGDAIIMDSVNETTRELCPDAFTVRVPTHDKISSASRKYARKAHLSFVGGTNLLCANWVYRSQWKIGLSDFWRIGNPILLGVGWHYYQRKSDPITGFMLRQLFKNQHKHSVRDSYTEQRLRDMGITNVINTGCVTMWGLTKEKCASIPVRKAENAIITVTAYRHDPELDRKWIDLVISQYKNVYFWSQMHDDLEYIKGIAGEKVKIIDTNLEAYNKILETTDIDFIGTRLHGGIRALQKGRRALIIEVDNRAREISRDTNLPTVKRDDVETIRDWIENPKPVTIVMPWDKIEEWKAQVR